MKRNVSKIYKQEDDINVYQTQDNPDTIYKEYLYVTDERETIEDMKLARKKLLAMKNRKQWPEFLIRPNTVERFNKYSYTAGFPFVDGINLQTYLQTKDIDIETLAKLMKKLEESVYQEKDFVFLDIANQENIMILPNSNGDIDFKIIDPDDVQFDEYKSQSISSLIIPVLSKYDSIRGIKKCEEKDGYNKQLDIRSMYALLYSIINDDGYFIPPFFEVQISEYESVLETFNIPESSTLYEKSMTIIDEKRPNKGIGNSLYELINDGYQLETYGRNDRGYQHRLVKR